MRSLLKPGALVIGALLFLGTSVMTSGCGEGSIEQDENGIDQDSDHDGPPDGDGEEPAATGSDENKADGSGQPTVVAASIPPRFQVPFPCGQAWSGQTRTGHSPQNSVDFNRTDDLGDTVSAAAAGTVSRVDNEGSVSYGRWVEVSHGNGWTTRYAHLSTQSVRQGQRVAAGQKLGTVGSTGGSSGPHLHYEQRLNGSAVRASFNGAAAFYFGSRTYTSKNACGGTSGGSTGGTTTSGFRARIDTAGPALTIRSGPGTNFPAVGSVADGASVTITCQKRGTTVTGTFGTSSLWDKIGGGFVADSFVFTGTDGRVAPDCP